MSPGHSSAGSKKISIACSERRWRRPQIPGAWLPPVDIHEESNQFVLHVDLPGVDPKAVEITTDQGVLTIRGQREDARRESREGYRRIERITGEFQRRFTLPDSADTQNIKAKFVNGVLEVAIPKMAQVQPHRITVEAA